MSLLASAASQEPERVDLDGLRDEENDVEYIGEALRQADGTYVCLARVDNCLCTVRVSLTPIKP